MSSRPLPSQQPLLRPAPRLKFPTSLAQFKAWLHQPGVFIQVINHELDDTASDPQLVTQVDNLGFTTADGTRRLFRSAKAWSFKGQYATLTISAETLHRTKPALVTYYLHNP